MRFLLVLSLLALAGCGEEVSPEERARRDAEAIAAVRATQVTPAVPVSLQPIGFFDIEGQGAIGLGCSFVADDDRVGGETGEGEALAIAMGDAAFVKRSGEVLRLAPDPGSPENPLGTRAKYDGREFSLKLDLQDGEGEQIGMETMGYDARLTLTDGRDRVVYRAEGIAECGA